MDYRFKGKRQNSDTFRNIEGSRSMIMQSSYTQYLNHDAERTKSDKLNFKPKTFVL